MTVSEDAPQMDEAAEDPRIDKLKAIVKILENSVLSSIEYEDEDIDVKLSRHPATGAVVQTSALVPASVGPNVAAVAHAAGVAPPAPAEDDGHVIKSPFVGTFYRSPSPEAAPFVEVGSSVEPQQALCIVEAMKLMNHIESDVKGVVKQVLAQNGDPVEFGQPLFKISVSS